MSVFIGIQSWIQRLINTLRASKWCQILAVTCPDSLGYPYNDWTCRSNNYIGPFIQVRARTETQKIKETKTTQEYALRVTKDATSAASRKWQFLFWQFRHGSGDQFGVIQLPNNQPFLQWEHKSETSSRRNSKLSSGRFSSSYSFSIVGSITWSGRFPPMFFYKSNLKLIR